MKVDCQKKCISFLSVCSVGLGSSVVFFETAVKEVKVPFISNHATISINKFKNYYKKKKCMSCCNLDLLFLL